MSRYEKDFQTKFNKYCKHILKQTAAYELKISDTKSIPFSDVKDHQEASLLNAKHGVFVMKIPDAGFQNPFDSFVLSNVPAYIVIQYEAQSRNQKEFFMIDIDVWCNEKNVSVRRSLTLDRAREIGVTHNLS